MCVHTIWLETWLLLPTETLYLSRVSLRQRSRSPADSLELRQASPRDSLGPSWVLPGGNRDGNTIEICCFVFWSNTLECALTQKLWISLPRSVLRPLGGIFRLYTNPNTNTLFRLEVKSSVQFSTSNVLGVSCDLLPGSSAPSWALWGAWSTRRSVSLTSRKIPEWFQGCHNDS